MEYYGRRNRRGRHRSPPRNPPPPIHVVQRPPKCSVFSGFSSFLLLSTLVAIIYLMLDYHCLICNKKCDLYNITKDLDDIALNISKLKESYTNLERTLVKFSQNILKIEGEIESLQSLANSMEKGDFIWKPKTDLALPTLDVFLEEPESITEKENELKNVTGKKYKIHNNATRLTTTKLF